MEVGSGQKTVERMALIGAGSRNSGKTALAKAVIASLCEQTPVAALKITVVRGACPHGEQGCGACVPFDGLYALTEETSRVGGKDTAQMLAAGASRVFWLRATEDGILPGFERFLAEIAELPEAVIVCESNSLREYVKPGCFIMLSGDGAAKESASRAAKYADITARGNEAEKIAYRLVITPTGGIIYDEQ